MTPQAKGCAGTQWLRPRAIAAVFLKTANDTQSRRTRLPIQGRCRHTLESRYSAQRDRPGSRSAAPLAAWRDLARFPVVGGMPTFCTHCGAPRGPVDAFCTACGAVAGPDPSAPPTASASRSPHIDSPTSDIRRKRRWPLWLAAFVLAFVLGLLLGRRFTLQIAVCPTVAAAEVAHGGSTTRNAAGRDG